VLAGDALYRLLWVMLVQGPAGLTARPGLPGLAPCLPGVCHRPGEAADRRSGLATPVPSAAPRGS
jgi:hypothetical protein